MNEGNEELKIILDLLGEWRNKYGVGYVTAHVSHDGYGSAYNFDNDQSRHEVSGDYGPWQKESQAGEAAQDQETAN